MYLEHGHRLPQQQLPRKATTDKQSPNRKQILKNLELIRNQTSVQGISEGWGETRVEGIVYCVQEKKIIVFYMAGSFT